MSLTVASEGVKTQHPQTTHTSMLSHLPATSVSLSVLSTQQLTDFHIYIEVTYTIIKTYSLFGVFRFKHLNFIGSSVFP
jgi:hypothetical protein